VASTRSQQAPSVGAYTHTLHASISEQLPQHSAWVTPLRHGVLGSWHDGMRSPLSMSVASVPSHMAGGGGGGGIGTWSTTTVKYGDEISACTPSPLSVSGTPAHVVRSTTVNVVLSAGRARRRSWSAAQRRASPAPTRTLKPHGPFKLDADERRAQRLHAHTADDHRGRRPQRARARRGQ
jgi:hypothetical protein